MTQGGQGQGAGEGPVARLQPAKGVGAGRLVQAAAAGEGGGEQVEGGAAGGQAADIVRGLSHRRGVPASGLLRKPALISHPWNRRRRRTR